MKSEWKEYLFSELCDITRGSSPRPINEYFSDKGIPWVKISDATVSSSRYINKTKQFIKLEGESLSTPVYPGDLILSNSATPGIPRFMGINGCIHDGWMLLRNFKSIDKNFVFYLLENERKFLLAQGNGAVFKNLKTDILKNHNVKIPSLSTQKKIAHILSTLDSKIELNFKMNQTLEEIAKSLFKSWFLDFDPVHAKANASSDADYDRIAKDLGITREILDLFPDEFEENELGIAPKGWSIKIMNDSAFVTIGKTPPRKEKNWFSESYLNNVKWVSIKDMGKSGAYIFDTSESLTKDAIEKFNIKVIPANTVILSFKLTLGRVSITTDNMCTNEAIAHFVVKGDLSTEYLYSYLKSFNFKLLGSTSSIATAINSKIIKNMPVVIPALIFVKLFNGYATDIFNKIKLNSIETLTLQKTRDTLLPKLLSGELDVSGMEIDYVTH